MKAYCDKCGKERDCLMVCGPGFEKGKQLCRKCHKWMKEMLKLIKSRVAEIDTRTDSEGH